MPLHHQAASAVAWGDEAHVRTNRDRYREKFSQVMPILAPVLEFAEPQGAFYLWPRTPLDDETFARRLYAEAGVATLPGSYLGRDGLRGNPGRNRLRLALVAELDDCVEAALRIRDFSAAL